MIYHETFYVALTNSDDLLGNFKLSMRREWRVCEGNLNKNLMKDRRPLCRSKPLHSIKYCLFLSVLAHFLNSCVKYCFSCFSLPLAILPSPLRGLGDVKALDSPDVTFPFWPCWRKLEKFEV